MNLIHTAVLLLLASLFLSIIRVQTSKGTWSARAAGLAWLSMAASAGCLIASLVFRSLEARYFALSNMYESLLMLIIWAQLAFLLLDRWFKHPWFAWPVCLLLLGALAFDLTLPTDIKPLQAALQSYWRSIHVPIIILSYALFSLSFVASVIALATGLWKRSHSDDLLPPSKTALAGPAIGMMAYNRFEPEQAAYESSGSAQKQANWPELLDEMTYRCILLGLPLLAVGIILGGLWANEAWGNYWSWDPKESMSLATLLGYGVYLHLRINGQYSRWALHGVSVLGYALMLVTYFGVNLMGLGLHSYGKIG